VKKSAGPNVEALIGAFLAAYLFLIALGVETLNPTNVDWLLADDPGTHYLGAQTYLREPWAFPLTKVRHFMYPIGTTLVQTDSIPAVGLAFKILSSIWPLPFPFQYFGLWLLSCYMLLGFFSFRLMRKTGATPGQAALATALVVSSPTFVNRFGHNALCAQWLVVAMLEVAWDWYHSAREKFPWKRTALLTGVAVGTHAYLAFTCGLMSFALFVGAWRAGGRTGNERTKEWAGWCAVQVAWAGLLGYFAVSHPKGGMFTEFGLDLTSFFNPGHRSQFFSQTYPPGIENMAYLGLGVFLLFAIATGLAIKHRRAIPKLFGDRTLKTFLWVLVFFFFYSFSPSITWRGQKLFSLLLLYKLITPIPDIFRACGRFIWPPYYAIFFAAVMALVRFAPRRTVTVLLTVALVAQGLDLGDWIANRLERMNMSRKTEEADLPPAAAGVAELRMVPPYLPDGDYECGEGSSHPMPVYLSVGVWAARYHLRFNSGFASRPFPSRLSELCRRTTEEWMSGRPEPFAAYLVRSELGRPSATHECTPWNGYFFCQPKPL